MRKYVLIAVLGIFSFLSASVSSLSTQTSLSAFKVAGKSTGTLNLSFQLPSYEFSSEQLDGKSYSRIKMADSGVTRDIGLPELPVLSTMVAIPATGSVRVETVNEQLIVIPGYEAYPFQDDEEYGSPKNLSMDREFYLRGSSYPENVVRFSDPQIIRGIRVITVQVSPFSYNPVTKELQVRRSLDLRVSFVNDRGTNELRSEPDRISSAFANLLQARIVNFDDYRGIVTANTPPRILILYGESTDTNFTDPLNAFAKWKKQKGAEVDMVSFTSTATTATVKAEIQSRYNNAASRPDFVIIIGDTNGNFPIPTFTETYSSYGGEGDYPYTHLDGTDTLGDCFLGRISVENADQFRSMITKTLLYERDVNISTAAWLNRMLLVGDWDPSGISTIYINKYIKEYALDINPDYTFTELYGSQPSATSMNASLSMGVGIFNYRGWLGMSGWNPSSSIVNSYRIPHSVNITCGTGSFRNSTSTTEAFTRLGSEGAPAGAVTAIGMATSHTHTGYNNTLDGGIFAGLLTYGMRTMGEALLHGKLYLFETYGLTHTDGANYSAHWCNLIGDPTMEVFLGIPDTYQITAPASIPVGYSLLDIVVKDASGLPVAGQCVTLSFGNDILARAYSDEYGLAVLTLPTPLSVGTGVITVSGHNFKPLQQDLAIVSGGIIPGTIAISDDNVGSSVGNGNGVVNSGERIELTFPLQNTGATHIRGVSGTITCGSPYIGIQNPSINYGDILSGSTVSNSSPVIVDIDPSCPDGTSVRLVLTLTSQAGVTYSISEHLHIYDGKISLASQTIIDGGNSALDPDESAAIRFVLTNSGSTALTGLSAELVSASQFITISGQSVSYGTISPSQTVQPSANISVYINALCLPGMVIPADLRVFNDNGFEQYIPINLTVGNALVTDPLGPDQYGYVIYDAGDLSYQDRPVYSWIGIAPAEGGSGTLLPIDDVYTSGDEGDQINSSYTATSLAVVDLPFTFSFYGERYSQITVCSNGFIALGATANGEFRNFRLPGAMGPSPMIAGFWDDLATSATGKVYTYYDSATHRFIVEWYRMLNGYNGSSEETFQIILYDHRYIATSTGDGPILIQYNTFNNVDSAGQPNHGNYATIGIQNYNQTIGLEYSFSNVYPTAAAPLGNGSALYITTVPVVEPGPNMTIMDITHNDTNGNSQLEPGETDYATISLKNIGDAVANGVSATLSTSDSYITLVNSTVNYGNMAALSVSSGSGQYRFSVSNDCPAGHTVQFALTVTSGTETWHLNFAVVVYRPNLEFGTLTIADPTGDNDGNLDPGETVDINILLLNTGGANSPAGTASMSCTTNGITVNDGSATFAAVTAGGSVNLSFTLSAASSMSIGSLASVLFNATAGIYNASSTKTVEIGAPTQIIIGSGTSGQTYPVDRYYNYSAHEAIYLASEIGLVGTIKSIAFNKLSGTDLNPAEAVSIYMKNTSESVLTTGVYSTTGYTLVYQGNFTNNAETGWMEVNLDTMFEYNGIQNLAILTVKGFQQFTYDYANYAYTDTQTTRARQNQSDSAAPTDLSAVTYLPNILIKMFPDTSILYPPIDFTAAASNHTIALSWQAPIAGSPDSYNIYRNGYLYDNEAGLSYYDVDVTNGITYNYSIKAVYDGEESSATPTVQATPLASGASSAIIGAGTSTSLTNEASPINITYKSSHGQAVYTASELVAAGITGPISITQLGFNIISAPSLPLSNFIVRIKHTTATNVASWHTADGLQTVYSNASYIPTAGGYDMLTLSTPFTWNGVDNILVDTAFGLVSAWTHTGQIEYTSVTNGYRYTWNDNTDQTMVFTGGSVVSRRPNIKIGVPSNETATISMPVTPLNFGSLIAGNTGTQQVTIQNTGTQLLAGYITCPTGFSIASVRTAGSKDNGLNELEADRLGYRFSIQSSGSLVIAITFAPTEAGSYSGNVVVRSNSSTNSVLNLPVSGTATPATLEVPVPTVVQSVDGILIQWNSIPNATQYKVYKSDSPTGPFSLVGTTTLPEFTDTAEDKAFYYIKAVQSVSVK